MSGSSKRASEDRRKAVWPETTPARPKARRNWAIFGCALVCVIVTFIVVSASL